MDVVLESTERRLEEFARLLVPALACALVDPADPAHDPTGLALLARPVEPLKEYLELLLAVYAAALTLDLRLDLFVDERKEERVVPVEEGDQGGQSAGMSVRSRLCRMLESEEGPKEGLESRGEARREDEVERREEGLAKGRQA